MTLPLVNNSGKHSVGQHLIKGKWLNLGKKVYPVNLFNRAE